LRAELTLLKPPQNMHAGILNLTLCSEAFTVNGAMRKQAAETRPIPQIKKLLNVDHLFIVTS
jgi:hypothetical protein